MLELSSPSGYVAHRGMQREPGLAGHPSSLLREEDCGQTSKIWCMQSLPQGVGGDAGPGEVT